MFEPTNGDRGAARGFVEEEQLRKLLDVGIENLSDGAIVVAFRLMGSALEELDRLRHREFGLQRIEALIEEINRKPPTEEELLVEDATRHPGGVFDGKSCGDAHEETE